jgi:acyl-CoA:6-aminopenicillanic acid acyl transferase
MTARSIDEQWSRKVYLDETDGARRWRDVLGKDHEDIEALAKQGLAQLCSDAKLPLWLIRFLSRLLYWWCALAKRRYLEDSDAIAKAVAFDPAIMAALQRVYTLSHFGCTAAVFRHPDHGMVHVRCLDWEVLRPAIIQATRLFDFQSGGKTVFVAVGVAGMVGVLSGIRPGKYSITINWAQSRSAIVPWARQDPTLLVRHVLETCDSYEDAVRQLADTEVGAPVYYMVCGAKDGEGCVIEVAHLGLFRQQENIRRLDGERQRLVQTNHYGESGALKGQNKKQPRPPHPKWEEESLEVSSRERRHVMEASIAGTVAQRNVSLAQLVESVRIPPVQNVHTVQQMVLHPRSGQVRIWAGVDPISRQ